MYKWRSQGNLASFFILQYLIQGNIVHMHFVDEYFSRYIHSLCNRP